MNNTRLRSMIDQIQILLKLLLISLEINEGIRIIYSIKVDLLHII